MMMMVIIILIIMMVRSLVQAGWYVLCGG